MQTTFIKIGNRYLNFSSIKSVKIYEEGGLRIFSNVPNVETPGSFYYYDIDDAEQAQLFLNAIDKMAIAVW